jgi:hypothetical protein
MTLYDDMDYHESLASLGIPHMKLFCLPIEVIVLSGSNPMIHYLVLAELEDTVDTFRRVGVAKYDPSEDQAVAFENPLLPSVEGFQGEGNSLQTMRGDGLPNLEGIFYKADKSSSRLRDIKII